MIKRLRIKFIALAMTSLLLVLVVIIGSVNALNYRNVVIDADSILEILAENGGKFPMNNGAFLPTAPKERPGGRFSPETPYESRYFSVLLDGKGNVVAADTGRIAAVDEGNAGAYAREVWSGGDTAGFAGNYRFLRQEIQAGTLIIFLDCSKNLSTFRAFFFISCGISLLGLLAVFLILVLCSGRIIKPVSESYEKQKQFITDAGHELKTPLTIIDADTEILTMEYGESEWTQDIRSQTRRLAALTNDLVSLSHLEEDQPNLQMIEFPFSDLVEETVSSFQALAKVQKKNFTSQIRPMLSLQGDEKSLRQMLSILLDNALKYSPEGGTIQVTLDKQGRNIRLTVFNTTGRPVTREQLSHMFDRFYRGDQSRNSKIGGYGIGLSIAKAAVSVHKGKISASTQDGQSLLMTVTFPT